MVISYSVILTQAARRVITPGCNNTVTRLLSTRLCHRVPGVLSSVVRGAKATSGLLYVSRSFRVTPPQRIHKDGDTTMESGKSPKTDSTSVHVVEVEDAIFSQVLRAESPTRDTEGDDSSQVARFEVNGAKNEKTSGNDPGENSYASDRLGEVTSLTESELVTESGSVFKDKIGDITSLTELVTEADSVFKDVESQQTRLVDGIEGLPSQDSEKLKSIALGISNSEESKDSGQIKVEECTVSGQINVGGGDPNQNRSGFDIHPGVENLEASFSDNLGMFKCPFSDQVFQASDEQTERPLSHGSSSKSGKISKMSESALHETCIEKEQETESVTSLVKIGDRDLTQNKMATDSTSDKDGRDARGDIVVVTGGNGFFGQHIVKMLQLRAPHVSEIWVLDVKPFEQKLDYQPTKKVISIIGDVTDAKFVAYSLQGATSVIHVAGIMSWGTFPDLEGMEKVNVKGTLNVLNACLKNNVKRLIYCSTVDVAIGDQPIRGGDETNTHVPDKFLFPGYPDTKYHGERIILGSGCPKRADGGQLQTLVLRANVCYGELDESYVTNALRMAKQNKGILYQVGDGSAMFQQAYVGNTAWAFVCADSTMRGNPELSNEIFYIPDNTPVQNSFNFIRPYLEAMGFQLSSRPINFPLLHRAVSVAEVFVKGLSPLIRLNLPFQSYTLAYINTDLYFSGSKARRVLNFEPIYSPNEARVASMKYYTTVDLDGGPTT